jgi:hypothetical protein
MELASLPPHDFTVNPTRVPLSDLVGHNAAHLDLPLTEQMPESPRPSSCPNRAGLR